MWNFSETLIEIVLRTAIVYFVILIGIRLAGKREVGQMTQFDLALLLLISNAVQNSMTGPDSSVTGGIVAAATLLVINGVMTQIVWKNRKMRKFVEGTPTILIRHGKVVEEHLAKERISPDALTQALREHGVASVSDVNVAVLEIDGSISVLKNDEVPSVDRPHRHFRFIARKSN